MKQLRPRDIQQIIKLGRQNGLLGYDGDCGQAAVAINRVVFSGRGTLVGFFNAALLEKQFATGHIVVFYDGIYWDVDGYPKTMEIMEEWGISRVDDPFDRDLADQFDLEWTEAAALGTRRWIFVDETAVITGFRHDKIDLFVQILTNAKAQYNHPLKRIARWCMRTVYKHRYRTASIQEGYTRPSKLFGEAHVR